MIFSLQINRSLQEEILKINQKLFNTEVEIEENVADYGKVKLFAVGEGTFIKCSFTPITYSSEMKLLLSSSEVSERRSKESLCILIICNCKFVSYSDSYCCSVR